MKWSSFVVEKWFRLLEYSFLIGVLKYFKEISGEWTIDLVYWLSYGLLYMWFLDFGECITDRLYSGKSIVKKTLVMTFATVPPLVLFFLLNAVADLVER